MHSQNWLVRSASEVEQNIVSVERILHYIELPPEAPWEVPGTVPEDWPAKGEIEFRQYSARYRPELDLVLKDLNVKIVRVVTDASCIVDSHFLRVLTRKLALWGGRDQANHLWVSSCSLDHHPRLTDVDITDTPISFPCYRTCLRVYLH